MKDIYDTIVGQILGKDDDVVVSVIRDCHGLYNRSIWGVIDLPKGPRVLDIGPFSGLSSCHMLHAGHKVTIAEPSPFGRSDITKEKAVDLMSVLYYSIYKEKMPDVDYIKAPVQYSDLGQYDDSYFFFPHPDQISNNYGCAYNIGKLVRKVMEHADRLTIVTERPDPAVLPNALVKEHKGRKGRLSIKAVDDIVWRCAVNLGDYDLNIIEYTRSDFNKL